MFHTRIILVIVILFLIWSWKPRISSLITTILAHDSLPESQCDGNFDLLKNISCWSVFSKKLSNICSNWLVFLDKTCPHCAMTFILYEFDCSLQKDHRQIDWRAQFVDIKFSYGSKSAQSVCINLITWSISIHFKNWLLWLMYENVCSIRNKMVYLVEAFHINLRFGFGIIAPGLVFALMSYF